MPEQTVPQKIELSEGMAYPSNPKVVVVPTSGEELFSALREAEEAEERWINRQL